MQSSENRLRVMSCGYILFIAELGMCARFVLDTITPLCLTYYFHVLGELLWCGVWNYADVIMVRTRVCAVRNAQTYTNWANNVGRRFIFVCGHKINAVFIAADGLG